MPKKIPSDLTLNLPEFLDRTYPEFHSSKMST